MPADPKQIMRWWEDAKAERGTFDSHWQDVADMILPSRSFTSTSLAGDKRRNRIYDSTAPKACTRLASAIHGLLFNPSTPWLKLGVMDPAFRIDHDSARWLEYAGEALMTYLAYPASGFPMVSAEAALDLVAFGSATIVDIPTSPLPRFVSVPLACIWWRGDGNDVITHDFRLFRMRGWELLQARRDLGWSLSDDTSRRLADEQNQGDWFDVLHCVYPRESAGSGYTRASKPWASIYLEVEQKHVMAEGGFDDNPYVNSRWSKASGEVYGRGVGMDVLPDVLTLNVMVKTNLIAGEMAVNPPIIVQVNTTEGPVRTAPRSISYVRQGLNPAQYPRAMEHGQRPDIGKLLIEEQREQVREAFFLDLFRLPENDRMTATEVLERRNQQLQLFSPIVSRLTSELASPVVAKTLRRLLRSGAILPAPDALKGQAVRIEYRGPMALAQRSSEGANWLRFVASIEPLAQIDPAVVQVNIDPDAGIRRLADIHNVSPQMLRSPEAARRQRMMLEQQRAMQQTVAMAEQGAGAARDAAAATKDLALVG